MYRQAHKSFCRREGSKNAIQIRMGIESNYGCKRHPNEQQSPGVCSSCLREKLLRLSNSHMHKKGLIASVSSQSSSPRYSSASSSSFNGSPTIRRNDSIIFMVSGNSELKKSRSIAFVSRREKKKGGFWSKLLRSTGKRTKEVLMHSKTVRERFH